MQFPGDYPMAPPFVRVIRPRFKFLTGLCKFLNLPGKKCRQHDLDLQKSFIHAVLYHISLVIKQSFFLPKQSHNSGSVF